MKQVQKKLGFTLTEILIVCTIIAILTGIIVIGHQSAKGQLALQRSANKLAQEIRRAEEMAMSAKECEIEGCGEDNPKGGYGIHFEKYSAQGATNYYIYLYADTTPPDERYDSSDPKEIISLEKGVKVKDVKLKKPGNEISPDNISINFKPPDPTVSLKKGNGEDFNEVEITLALEDKESQTKTIIANKAGLITVE